MVANITVVMDNFCTHDDLNDSPSYIRLIKNPLSQRPAFDINVILFNLFGHNFEALNYPTAVLTALSADLPIHEGWWLRADPVRLLLDGVGIYMLGNSHLNLEEAEILPLQNMLKDYFASENIMMFTPTLTEWYLQLTEPPDIQTYSLSQIFGKHIDPYLPTGKHKKKWLRMLTEIQMMLHPTEQTNPFNSVWFWGEGNLPDKNAYQANWKAIWGDTSLAIGLARYHDLPIFKPVTFKTCLNQITKGNYLVILDSKNLMDIESEWMQPILESLIKKQVKCVDIYNRGNHYRVNQRSLLGWRRFFSRFLDL